MGYSPASSSSPWHRRSALRSEHAATNLHVDLPPQRTGFGLTLSEDLIRGTDLVALADEMDAASAEYARQVVAHMLQTVSVVREATGNVVHSGDQPVSFEHIYAMLERIEFSLDENDELAMPSLVMHPDTVTRLEPATPDQQARSNDGAQSAVFEACKNPSMNVRLFLRCNAPKRERTDRSATTHQLTRIYGDLTATADYDDAAIIGQKFRIVGEVYVGEHLQNYVHAAVACRLQNLFLISKLVVIENLMRTLPLG